MQRFFTLLASALLLSSSFTFALPSRRDDTQSGTIEIETSTVSKDPFKATQDRVIDQIKTSSLANVSQSDFLYLNSAYLYCTINKGTCPEILDALLYADFTTSKQQNKANCPILESFWKQWIENQFEQRQNYLGKIAFFSQTNEFNSKKRNGYIKCRETIAQMLTEQAQPPSSEANAKAAAILEQIKATVPNVIDAIGAQAKTVAATPKAATKSEPASSSARAAPVSRP